MVKIVLIRAHWADFPILFLTQCAPLLSKSSNFPTVHLESPGHVLALLTALSLTTAPRTLCASSHLEAKMASYRFPIESLPSEIKHQICSYLSQKKLHPLILTSKALSGAAAISLYRVPRFLSTYRFAQFVTTISHSRHYADMVRSFNLWDSHEGENQIDELASWMEWKYRSVPLYAARPPPAPLCKQVKRDSKRVMHPRCNEFLSKSSCSRGIPVGAIVHVLSACRNLR